MANKKTAAKAAPKKKKAALREIELRNSERHAFTTCPWKWNWAYNDRYKMKIPGPALRFGLLVHEAMEHFYKPGIKRGPKPAETFEKLYQKELKTMHKIGFRDEDGTWYEAGEMGVLLLEAYYNKWGKDDRWRVLATELPFRCQVTDENTGYTFTYVGVMDGLWLDRESGKRKDLWIPDHKTTSDNPTTKGDALVLDEQAGSYWSYGVDYLIQQSIIKSNERLTGMMFNFLRKGKPDTRPTNAEGHALNKDGTVSLRQPTPLFHREPVYRDEYDKAMAKDRIIAQATIMRYMREGKLPIYKVPGVLHSPHCKWCEFKDPCELHETGGDFQYMLDTMYEQWNPYEQHIVREQEVSA